jgi:hypothetical protein
MENELETDTSGDETSAPENEQVSGELTVSENSEESARRASGKSLSAEQWTEIRDAYERKSTPITILAEKYGVSKSAISQHFKKHKVARGALAGEEALAAVEAAAKTAPAPEPTFAEKRTARIVQTREETYNWLRMLSVRGLKMLAEAEASGSVPASVKESTRTLAIQTKQIIEAGDCRLRMLEADKHVNEEELPQIHIRDLTEEDILKIREEDDENEDGVEEDDSVVTE